MAMTIREWHGYRVEDQSLQALVASQERACPFIGDTCTKTFRDGQISGVCSLKPSRSGPVVCCPNRLYGDDWKVLTDVVEISFGAGHKLVAGPSARGEARRTSRPVVGVFGKSWGGELHLPQRSGTGAYYVDYILALILPSGELAEFVAVEVQSIDTTGSYRSEWENLELNRESGSGATSGFNWENVSKRILPQLIYKGNVLQQEEKCKKGLFFITPKPVYDRIIGRLLGGTAQLPPYPLSSSALTFLSYDPDWNEQLDGSPAPLRQTNRLTSHLAQVAQAFVSVSNLPPAGSYKQAIEAALRSV